MWNLTKTVSEKQRIEWWLPGVWRGPGEVSVAGYKLAVRRKIGSGGQVHRIVIIINSSVFYTSELLGD